MNCPDCRCPLAAPSATCSRWAEHDRQGFDRWETYENRPEFRAWAGPARLAKNGSRYRVAIVQPVSPRGRWFGSGLEWRILSYSLPLPGDAPQLSKSSGGAFYDDASEHAALGGAMGAAIKYGLDALDAYATF